MKSAAMASFRAAAELPDPEPNVDASGVRCGNCGAWRLEWPDYTVEECPKCGDDEYNSLEAEMALWDLALSPETT